MLLNQLITNFCIFLVAIFGILLNRRYIIIILICIEMMLLSINLNFLILSNSFDDMYGHMFCFFILTVAAAESAIGLALIIMYFRTRSDISIVKAASITG